MSESTGLLGRLSDELAGAVENAGRSVVRVNARRRMPASGLIWSADGAIVTADHVIEREEDITVGLEGGNEVPADGFVRTDAVLLPGFSGGALVDVAGRAVGLATSHFGQGSGFAIRMGTVQRVAEQLLQ